MTEHADARITPIPHKLNGSEHLTEADVLAYLVGAGYETEAPALLTEANRFPGTHKYTADRHRYLVFIMPGAYWRTGNCAASEERIKRLGQERRGRSW